MAKYLPPMPPPTEPTPPSTVPALIPPVLEPPAAEPAPPPTPEPEPLITPPLEPTPEPPTPSLEPLAPKPTILSKPTSALWGGKTEAQWMLESGLQKTTMPSGGPQYLQTTSPEYVSTAGGPVSKYVYERLTPKMQKRVKTEGVKGALADYLTDGGYDVVRMRQAGISEQDIAQLFSQQIAKSASRGLRDLEKLPEIQQQAYKQGGIEGIKQLQNTLLRDLEPYKVEGGYNIVAALEGGVASQTLEALGFDWRSVVARHSQAMIEAGAPTREFYDLMGPYKTEGGYDLLAAITAGVPHEVLKRGFTEEQLALAKIPIASRDRTTDRTIAERHTEAVAGVVPGTAEFNRGIEEGRIPEGSTFAGLKDGLVMYFPPIDPESLKGLDYLRAYNYTLTPGAIATLPDNIDDWHNYRRELLTAGATEKQLDAEWYRYLNQQRARLQASGAHVPAGSMGVLTKGGPLAKEEQTKVKEVVIALTPVLGTVYFWNKMSTPWKVISIAADLTFVVPLVKAGIGALRGAKAARVIDTSQQLADVVRATSERATADLAKVNPQMASKYQQLLEAQAMHTENFGALIEHQRALKTAAPAIRDEMEAHIKFLTQATEDSAKVLDKAANDFVGISKEYIFLDDPLLARSLERQARDAVGYVEHITRDALTPEKFNLTQIRLDVANAKAVLVEAQSRFPLDSSKWIDLSADVMNKEARLLETELGSIKAIQESQLAIREQIEQIISRQPDISKAELKPLLDQEAELVDKLYTATKGLEYQWPKLDWTRGGGSMSRVREYLSPPKSGMRGSSTTARPISTLTEITALSPTVQQLRFGAGVLGDEPMWPRRLPAGPEIPEIVITEPHLIVEAPEKPVPTTWPIYPAPVVLPEPKPTPITITEPAPGVHPGVHFMEALKTGLVTSLEPSTETSLEAATATESASKVPLAAKVTVAEVLSGAAPSLEPIITVQPLIAAATQPTIATEAEIASLLVPAIASATLIHTVPEVAPQVHTSIITPIITPPITPPIEPLIEPPIIIPPILPRGQEVKEKRQKYPIGTVVWRQGAWWKIIPPPYTAMKPLSSRLPPKGVTTLIGTPQQTLTFIGGIVPARDISFDLGVTDGFIDVAKRRIVFTGEGLKTDVGKRLSSRTRGLSIPASRKPGVTPTAGTINLKGLELL